MIEHLSAEQISQWMVGERTPQLERHVADCEECRGELRQLEDALVQFRGAVRQMSGAAAPPAWRRPAGRRQWLSWPRLAVAAATLLLLISAPVYWNVHERQRAAAAAEAARADSLLLERVDSEISRAVPEPMEPLVTLVAWNNPAEKSTKVER